ncbi:MAG TPA: DUF1761 domain-containing protein [Bacteroidales bacterium]|nr:DUF1761 domain-containing protein [Bacteroidales bacterium]HRX98338.1 DUF1761 domain-containing protein [Bacteroidales bacterium]
MENLYINHWAVIVSAALNLILGAVWYSPALFYNAWKRENNLDDEFIKKNAKPAVTYTLAFILALIISYNLAFFLGDDKTDWQWGMTAGFLAGFGWSTMIFAVIALFEFRSWRYIFINGGYITVYFTLVGLILGLWR